LKAGAEMGRAAGDTAFADELERMGQAGADYLNAELFNGNYFIQKTDLGDKALIEKFDHASGKVGVIADGFMETYWSDEYGQMKYQFNDGCATDQILGQWHADLAGLGSFLDPDKVQTALASAYRHNYRADLKGHFNPCRVYAYEDEGGVLIATWPEGTTKPAVPAPYSEEVWTGLEYMLASHLIFRGLTDEGLAIVRTARARHDGYRRNPWNEIECGSYYARSMSSFALVNAWSGLSYDLTKGAIGFAPKDQGDGNWFWSVGEGWGVVSRSGNRVRLEVRYGSLDLAELSFGGATARIDRKLGAGDAADLTLGG
ncbi:MAG: hypothetical protein K0Q69_2969, partial [Devosia sp.]|nr:hypothetical protein [Devosia sp.]